MSNEIFLNSGIAKSSIIIKILGGGGCGGLGGSDLLQGSLGAARPLGAGDHHQVRADTAHAHPPPQPHVASLAPRAPGVLNTYKNKGKHEEMKTTR